ncbi:uncharacterized protein LOC121784227 [Salvia splendens]|uniref:uncharacterized protein LOC121784227 n=1 Tax=Salvia splendens TaxID=180675 RepID=UPI001C2620D0|nr:uncharacterized protein LOC121784227 [Salvia splendens]
MCIRDRRGKAGRNWVDYHAHHIQKWDNRHNLVWIDLEYTMEPIATGEYMNWFRQITVVYLTKPGVHAEEGFLETASSHNFAVETLHNIRHFISCQDMTEHPALVTISRMVEDGLQISVEAELMDYRPSQRSALDMEMTVRQKGKRRTKKKTACGESSSSRMDAQLVDDSDDDFVDPPPPRSTVRGRQSVSHTGGTGEDIGLSDVHASPPRSSVQDDFFWVDLENVVLRAYHIPFILIMKMVFSPGDSLFFTDEGGDDVGSAAELIIRLHPTNTTLKPSTCAAGARLPGAFATLQRQLAIAIHPYFVNYLIASARSDLNKKELWWIHAIYVIQIKITMKLIICTVHRIEHFDRF